MMSRGLNVAERTPVLLPTAIFDESIGGKNTPLKHKYGTALQQKPCFIDLPDWVHAARASAVMHRLLSC
jgi:hypothetical protein